MSKYPTSIEKVVTEIEATREGIAEIESRLDHGCYISQDQAVDDKIRLADLHEYAGTLQFYRAVLDE